MGMFLRRGRAPKFTVSIAAPVSYSGSSTYTMYGSIDGTKISEQTTLTAHRSESIRVIISYRANSSKGIVYFNGAVVQQAAAGTYEFVATKDVTISFNGNLKYDGDGSVIWTPTCNIIETA